MRENDWKIRVLCGVVTMLLLSVVFIGFVMITEGPIGSDYTLPVHVIYEDNCEGEKAITTNRCFEGTSIAVRFFNLSIGKPYFIHMGGMGLIKQFNDTEEITIIIPAYEDSWCYLAMNYTTLIWIWVGDL